MYESICEFPFSHRARAVVAKFVKVMEKSMPLPASQRFTAVKGKTLSEWLLSRPGKKEEFEATPTNWELSYCDSITVKRGRVYLNFRLKVDTVRLSDGVHQWDGNNGPAWYSHEYKEYQAPTFEGGREKKSVDVGVQFYPLSAQQMSYLLGRTSEAGWGVARDLKELKKAPDGLFCSHTIHQ